MVNLVGDSCWDLQAMIESKKEVSKSKPKKVKQEAPPKPATKRGKKSKPVSSQSENNNSALPDLPQPSNAFGTSNLFGSQPIPPGNLFGSQPMPLSPTMNSMETEENEEKEEEAEEENDE